MGKISARTGPSGTKAPDAGRIFAAKGCDGCLMETVRHCNGVMEQAEWKLLPQAVAMLCEQLEQEKKS